MTVLEVLQGRLPRRPYCTNDLTAGLKIRPLDKALEHKYIQFNPPALAHWLLFDIDRQGGAFAWEDANLPPPNLAISNPHNGYAHLAWALRAPVCTSDAALGRPLRYLAAIEEGMRLRLAGDLSYSGLMLKNPISPAWRTFQPVPGHHLYDLQMLHEWLDDLPRRLSAGLRKQSQGYGRNVDLFDRLRFWSYTWVQDFKARRSYDHWQEAVRRQADRINDFAVPLGQSEIRATTRSIAKWTWTRYTGEGSEEAAALGRMGGRPGVVPRGDIKPWALEGVSRATWFRRQRNKPPPPGVA